MQSLSELIATYNKPDILLDSFNPSSKKYAAWGFDEIFEINHKGCFLNNEKIDGDYFQILQNIISKYSEELSGALKIHLDREPPLVTPPLRITVELSEKFKEKEHERIIDKIQENIKNILSVKVQICLVPFGSFERSVRKTVLIDRDDIIN